MDQVLQRLLKRRSLSPASRRVDDGLGRRKELREEAADCSDLISRHGLDPETTRKAIAAMLEEQPLPPRRGTPSSS